MMVQFGLLGSFEVRIAGNLLRLRSPKLRILLAALLLQPRHAVSTPELAEAIWEGKQPRNPRRAVQLYVTRLRSAHEALDRLIITCPGGYRIDATPDQIDIEVFDDRIAEADNAAAERDPGREAKALANALALYRGDLLADVASDSLRREPAIRWRERRLTTLERYFDVELAGGRHAEIIGDLSSLVNEHPFRERLWAQLITALHRGGRRAEALRVFHMVRQRLSHELGIDPGTELQDLHAVILSGQAPPVPRQLPPEVAGFVGRQRYLAQIDEHPLGVCVITGPAGAGKTALAVHWGRRSADNFPDGQVWLDLGGYGPGPPLPVEQALTRLLRTLGVADKHIPFDVADQVGLYRSLMDGRRMLVVLDNAHNVQQVRPLLPGGQDCFVLVTARSHLSDIVSAEAAALVVLDLLTPGEARDLLVERLGRQRVDAEPEAVERLLQLCAGLPLALAVATARITSRPRFTLKAAADQVAEAGSSLTAHTFSWSYQALSPAAARLFRLLGNHRGAEFGVFAAAALAEVSTAEAEQTLAELCESHLLTELEPGRYLIHDLLHDHAAKLSGSTDSVEMRTAATQRALDHYLHTAARASLVLNPHRETRIGLGQPVAGSNPRQLRTQADALAWFAAEHHVLMQVVTGAAASGFASHAWKLSWALAVYLDRIGQWRDQLAAASAGLEAARARADLAGQAIAHRGLGNAHMRLGDLNAACVHLEAAVELFGQLDETAGQASAHRGIAAIRSRQGAHEAAVMHARNASRLYRSIGDENGLAHMLNAAGWYQALDGKFAESIVSCAQALKLMRKVNDRLGEAASLDSLGFANFRLGRHEEAIACYSAAAKLAEEIQDPYHLALILDHLGDAFAASGEVSNARLAWRQSIAIAEPLEDADGLTARVKLASSVEPTSDGNEVTY